MSDLSGKYKVYLGGRERGLRYTLEDRETLEGMFPRNDGTPNDIFTLVRHIIEGGSFAVQAALLWKGVQRVDSRITLAKVKDWLTKHVAEGSDLKVIYTQVFNAIMESGITGTTVKDAVTETDEGEDQDAPKAEASPPES